MKNVKLLLLLVLSIMLVACSSKDEENKNADKVDVDKGMVNVEVTLPASLFEDTDMEALKKDAKEDGVKEVTVNDDGSVTYKMSKSKHKEMLNEMADTIDESIKEIEEDKEFPSIKTIEHNKSFTKYTITMDQKLHENSSMDGFAFFNLAFQSMYYQYFNGVSEEDYKVTFQLKNEETSKIFDTIIYPDDLQTDQSNTEKSK